MKKLLSIVLVSVLVVSFLFGAMVTDGYAKKNPCRVFCDDNGAQWECCPPGMITPDFNEDGCRLTGLWCW